MEDSLERSLERNPRNKLLRELRVLKYFYTFKELESLLEIPGQVLWRYIMLRSVPEKTTTSKLLEKIRALRLFERVFEEKLPRSMDLWGYLGNPGILELASLKAYEKYGKLKIEIILSAPDEYSAALASQIATSLKARLCISSIRPLSSNLITEPLQLCSGLLASVGVPKKCLERNSKILLVTLDLDPTRIKPLIRISMKARASIAGLFSLSGSEENVAELRELLGEEVPITFLIDNKVLFKGSPGEHH